MQIETRDEEGLGTFWTHSNLDNISVHITYHYSLSNINWFNRDYEIITILNTGWQSVLATIEEFEVSG
jgi:hypothetical protein